MPHRVLMLLSTGFTHDLRVANAARALTRAGYEVTVLAWDRRGTLPTEEMHDGIRIVRVRNSLAMRLRAFDLFRLRPYWRKATRSALALHRDTPFAVVHAHDLDTLPIGARFKRHTGAHLVYDAHEFFPDMVREMSRAKLWAGRFAALETRLVPEADAVVVAAPAQHEYFSRMTRAPITTVSNSRPLAYRAYVAPHNERMKVTYIGGLQGFRLLVPLAELAVEDDSFDVDIAGWGPIKKTIVDLARRSRGNLRYLGAVPMDEVVTVTHGSDVVHSMLNPSSSILRHSAPNKFFEALVAGRPILVTKDTWVGDQVVAADCGLAIDYSKEALRSAIRVLQTDPARRQRMGQNALRLAEERYNWARDEASLLLAYRQILGGQAE